MTISVVFVGLGVMGQRMLSNMKKYGGYDVIAGWDPNPAACKEAKQIAPDLTISENPFDMISRPDVDLIYIACPPSHHKTYAMAAIAAGKAIYCEKPLGVDLKESAALVTAVEAAGNRHCVNFSLASAAAVNCIEDGLSSDTIGEVKAVDIHLHFCKWPRDWQVPAAWLFERDEGGFVRETFSHYAYLAHRLFGPGEIRQAYSRYPDDNTSAEFQSVAALDYNGIPVSFIGGTGGIATSGSDKIEFTVWGTKAVYRLYDWNRIRTSTGSGWVEELTEIDDLREEGYRRTLENVSNMMQGGAHSMPSFSDAYRVQEIVEGILGNDAS